jgi:peptidoglycan/LPS O-acetylase OafA/YrhL
MIALHRWLRRWRARLSLVFALLVLGTIVAATHVPGGSPDPMDGHHMDGAALCLAVLGAGGALARSRRSGASGGHFARHD